MRAFFPVVIGVLSTAGTAAAESANDQESRFQAAGRRHAGRVDGGLADARMRPIFQRIEGCPVRASMRRASARRAITASATSTKTCRFRRAKPTKWWPVTAAGHRQSQPLRAGQPGVGPKGLQRRVPGRIGESGRLVRGAAEVRLPGRHNAARDAAVAHRRGGGRFLRRRGGPRDHANPRRVAKVASCPVMPSQTDRSSGQVTGAFIAKAAAPSATLFA